MRRDAERSTPPTRVPLRVTVDWISDHVLALAFGHVVDGKPEREYIALNDRQRLILSAPKGDPDCELIGFVVDGVSGQEPDELADQLWEGPRFEVPLLGLRNATAGEILTAALAAYPENSTLDAQLFHEAVQYEGEHAAELWRLCLDTGDLRAHFALGYTLYELNRGREAYSHLRYYTELAPNNSWAWCWLGHACAGNGDAEEAIEAYRRALELEEQGGFETDAAERLFGLGAEAS